MSLLRSEEPLWIERLLHWVVAAVGLGVQLLKQSANEGAKVFHGPRDPTLRGCKDNNQRQNQDAYESIKSSSAHKTTF